MSSRSCKWLTRFLPLSLAALSAVAQPQPTAPAAGAASISGVVTNSVTGAPLPRAHVGGAILGNTGAQFFEAVTDTDGKFSVEGLPAGRIIISANRAGFVAPASGNRLSDTQLRAAERRENVKLALAPTGAISGRVLNADGLAVPGAIVSIEGGPFGLNPATTDEKGQFRISGLPPGRYRVVANPAVMPFPPEIRTDGTREVHYARTYYPDALTSKAAQRIEVGAGIDAMGMDIRLVRTPIVTVSGRVSDIPAGGKTLVRALLNGAVGNGVQATANVKPDGSFQIWQLDPGTYTLVATNTASAPGPSRGLQSTQVEIEVAGKDIERVELRMIQPFDLTARLAFDDAKAREAPAMQSPQRPGQQPAAQATPRPPAPRRIMLRPEGQSFVNFGPSIFQPMEVGADDSITVEKLLPARYHVTATWGPYVKSVTIGTVETEGDTLDLRNGPAGPVTVTLASVTGEVSGVVSDPSGPVAGVRITMLSDRGPAGTQGYRAAMSGPDGNYSFKAVPPGKYKLVVGDADSEEPAETVDVHAGDKLVKALAK